MKKTGHSARAKRWNWRLWLRGIWWLAVLAATTVAALEAHRAILDDPRFVLSPGAEDSAEFVVEGLRYTSRDRVMQVFADDFGKHIALVPVEERRLRLLGIDWVRDASISRIWPNRLVVRISERMPVAFLRLTRDPSRPETAHPALIDAEGVILRQPERASFSFPLLAGVDEREPEEKRREKVRRAQRVLDELDEWRGSITDVDVGATDLTITMETGGSVVELVLGKQKYRTRLRDFLDSFGEIRKVSPKATSFDLRIDGRITARN
ncbi:MAG: FtsQ-type POTRA domain-containing protein [Bryobacterales bacterium]|jgi:cell division protein FtsQ|nr:FtsQ-type POTRA domain-containing protein [Bryobacterales bacterium]